MVSILSARHEFSLLDAHARGAIENLTLIGDAAVKAPETPAPTP